MSNDHADHLSIAEEASAAIKTFDYQGPPENDVKPPKEHVRLCRSDVLRADVQIVRKGGDNNLHSHSGNDGFWFVLAGRARFYGPDGAILGEFGPHQGLFMPRNAAYWFESVDNEKDLELLHVAARDSRVADIRTDYEPRKKRSRIAR